MAKSGFFNRLQGFQSKFRLIGFGLFSQVLFFLAKVLVCKVTFLNKCFGKFGSGVLYFRSFGFCKVSIAKNFVACKIKSVGCRACRDRKAGFCFLGDESCSNRTHLTKRAPDAGDSAAISSSFPRLFIFPVGRLRRPRPSAGNANRWLAGIQRVEIGVFYEYNFVIFQRVCFTL